MADSLCAPPHIAEINAEARHIEAVKSRIGAREFIAMMALLMATNACAIDVILPALEEMKSAFHITGLNQQQYVIFAFLGGFGIAQLIFGPLADCFGRRRPLLLGLILYTALSFACAFTPNFETLLVLRALQGIGAAAMRVISISIIRDIYRGRKMAEIMSAVMMIFMIVPIIAPACGKLILQFGTWRTIFNVMAYAGLLTSLWVLQRLPETLLQSALLALLLLIPAFPMCCAAAFHSVIYWLFPFCSACCFAR